MRGDLTNDFDAAQPREDIDTDLIKAGRRRNQHHRQACAPPVPCPLRDGHDTRGKGQRHHGPVVLVGQVLQEEGVVPKGQDHQQCRTCGCLEVVECQIRQCLGGHHHCQQQRQWVKVRRRLAEPQPAMQHVSQHPALTRPGITRVLQLPRQLRSPDIVDVGQVCQHQGQDVQPDRHETQQPSIPARQSMIQDCRNGHCAPQSVALG